MQIACSRTSDSAISKTIQLPPEFDAEAVGRLGTRAWERGLKGFTVFPRISPIGAVLLAEPSEICDAPSCDVAL
jgi:ribonucleotide reductase alpha subunit